MPGPNDPYTNQSSPSVLHENQSSQSRRDDAGFKPAPNGFYESPTSQSLVKSSPKIGSEPIGPVNVPPKANTLTGEIRSASRPLELPINNNNPVKTIRKPVVHNLEPKILAHVTSLLPKTEDEELDTGLRAHNHKLKINLKNTIPVEPIKENPIEVPVDVTVLPHAAYTFGDHVRCLEVSELRCFYIEEFLLVGEGILTNVVRTIGRSLGQMPPYWNALVAPHLNIEATKATLQQLPIPPENVLISLENFDPRGSLVSGTEKAISRVMNFVDFLIGINTKRISFLVAPPKLRIAVDPRKGDQEWYLAFLSQLVAQFIEKPYFNSVLKLCSAKTLVTNMTYCRTNQPKGKLPTVTTSFPIMKDENIVWSDFEQGPVLRVRPLTDLVVHLMDRVTEPWRLSKYVPDEPGIHWSELNKSNPQSAIEPVTSTPISVNPSSELCAEVYIAGAKFVALFDTGAVISLMNPIVADYLRQVCEPEGFVETPIPPVSITGVSGGAYSQILSVASVLVRIPGGTDFRLTFYIATVLHHDLIIGNDMLQAYHGIIYTRQEYVTLRTSDQRTVTIGVGSKKDKIRPKVFVVAPLDLQYVSDEQKLILGQIWEKLLASINDRKISVHVGLEFLKRLTPVWAVFGRDLGTYNGPTPTIRVIPTEPWCKKQYPVAYRYLDAARVQIRAMEENRIIEKSNSAFLSPLVVVTKPSGEIRICIDAHNFNKIVIRQSTEPPNIMDLLYAPRPSKYLSTLDLAQGFLQIRVEPEISKYLAFNFEGQTYQYIRLPFGTSVSPSVFMTVINTVLSDLIGPKVCVYVDDILVSTDTVAEHLECLIQVLTRLERAGLRVSIKKTNILKENLTHLGFTIGQGEIRKSPNKFTWFNDFEKKMATKTIPTGVGRKVGVRTLQSLVGFTLYYSTFIPRYTDLTAPFYEAIGSGVNDTLIWTQELYDSYVKLKEAFCQDMVLIRPNYDRPLNLHLTMDESARRIHGILTQYDEGGSEKVVIFYSKCLAPTECSYIIQEKFLLMLYKALLKLKPFIYNSIIHIATHYETLLSTARTLAGYNIKFGRWCILFNSCDLRCTLPPFKKSIHGKLIQDKVSDLLLQEPALPLGATDDEFVDPSMKAGLYYHHTGASNEAQLTEKSVSLAALGANLNADKFEVNYCGVKITDTLTKLTDNLPRYQRSDIKLNKIITQLKQPEKSKYTSEYTLVDDILHRKIDEDSFTLPLLPSHFADEFIRYMHAFYNHPGGTKLITVCRRFFWWSGMTGQIKRFTKRCLNCKESKIPNQKNIPEFGRVQSHALGSKVSVDLYGPLPASKWGHTYVIVFRDLFSGYVWGFSLKEATASACANKLDKVVDFVAGHQRTLETVLTDNGVQFRSREWHSRCDKHKIKNKYTTTYNPSSNPVERTMREIGKGLRLHFNRLRHSNKYDGSHAGWGHVLTEIIHTLNDLPSREGVYSANYYWGIESPENPFPGLAIKFPPLENETKKISRRMKGPEGSETTRDYLIGSSGDVLIYVDGGCLANGRQDARGATGVWFNCNHELNKGQFYRFAGNTNNRMELQAILNALKIAVKNKIQKMTIVSDSRWAIGEIQKGRRDLRKVKTHTEIVTEIVRKHELVESVEYHHVYGHCIDQGNIEADAIVTNTLIKHDQDLINADNIYSDNGKSRIERYLNLCHSFNAIKQELKYSKRNHTVTTFEIGDIVVIKVHTLSDKSRGRVSKLDPKMVGPYVIVKKLGVNLYLVDDVDSKNSRHLTVNVRQLSLFGGSVKDRSVPTPEGHNASPELDCSALVDDPEPINITDPLTQVPEPIQDTRDSDIGETMDPVVENSIPESQIPVEPESTPSKPETQVKSDSTLCEPKVQFMNIAEYRSYFKNLLALERSCLQQEISTKRCSDVELRWEVNFPNQVVVNNSEQIRSLSLKVGDIVKLSHSAWTHEGVVMETRNVVKIKLDPSLEIEQPQLVDMTPVLSSVPYKRMEDALERFGDKRAPLRTHHVRQILGLTAPREIRCKPIELSLPKNYQNLNSEQSRAIELAAQNTLTLIHGPPGTGKTATAAALTYQLCTQYEAPVLVCAGSNSAVDLLAARIGETGLVVRRVYSKRMKMIRDEQPETYRQITNNSDNSELPITVSVVGTRNQKTRTHPTELTSGEDFTGVDAICTTCVEAGSATLRNLQIKTVILDETSMITEPEALIAMVHANTRVVLIGDPQQLGTVVRSQKAEQGGLGVTLYDRLIRLGHKSLLLRTQYRMHSGLAQFPNEYFYDNKLITGCADEERSLSQLKDFWPHSNIPSLFIDIKSQETKDRYTNSYLNSEEVKVIIDLIRQFTNLGIAGHQIGIISMYEAQRRELQECLDAAPRSSNVSYSQVQISSVDAFQGQERDLIILSCVRSNKNRNIGFLSDIKRLNAALTRARMGLVLVGDSRTLMKDQIWYKLINFYKENDLIRNT